MNFTFLFCLIGSELYFGGFSGIIFIPNKSFYPRKYNFCLSKSLKSAININSEKLNSVLRLKVFKQKKFKNKKYFWIFFSSLPRLDISRVVYLPWLNNSRFVSIFLKWMILLFMSYYSGLDKIYLGCPTIPR